MSDERRAEIDKIAAIGRHHGRGEIWSALIDLLAEVDRLAAQWESREESECELAIALLAKENDRLTRMLAEAQTAIHRIYEVAKQTRHGLISDIAEKILSQHGILK